MRSNAITSGLYAKICSVMRETKCGAVNIYVEQETGQRIARNVEKKETGV